MDMILVLVALVGGYVASIYTWPALRTWIVGVEAEISRLQDRISKLQLPKL